MSQSASQASQPEPQAKKSQPRLALGFWAGLTGTLSTMKKLDSSAEPLLP